MPSYGGLVEQAGCPSNGLKPILEKVVRAPILERSGDELRELGATMPKFHTRVPHALSDEEVRQRLDGFPDVVREKLQNQVSDLEQSWDGDTLRFRFKTFGIPLSGNIALGDRELVVDGELPLTAMMFKGRIESSIQEQLAKLVG